jgi:hypothetical protein
MVVRAGWNPGEGVLGVGAAYAASGTVRALSSATASRVRMVRSAWSVTRIPYRGVVADRAMRVIETLDRILGWGVARPEADLTKAAGELREVIERHPTNTYRHATPGVG